MDEGERVLRCVRCNALFFHRSVGEQRLEWVVSTDRLESSDWDVSYPPIGWRAAIGIARVQGSVGEQRIDDLSVFD
jgi:hypothetical protein